MSLSGGVSVWGGDLCPGGLCLGGRSLSTRVAVTDLHSFPREQTDTCESITFPHPKLSGLTGP